MTTVSSDANESSAGARVYSQVTELEKQLKAQIKEKRAFHPDVRNIRVKLREKYVEIILSDPEFSEKQDVATSLWHVVYYTMIEEFRTRIRYATTSAKAGQRNSLSPQKLLADFKIFIAEATKFYSSLISKLRRKYGLGGVTAEGPESDSLAVDGERLTEYKKCCYKLYIQLGDLARYKELHSDVENYTPDWKVPASYYFKAVSLWPFTGHPHNQLAVLATYMGNDFLAVYHYFRSLAVEDPFTTARGNLTLLFERNRQQFAELSVQKRSLDSQRKESGSGKSKGRAEAKEEKDSKDVETVKFETKKTFFIRFVRLNGILFTKTSLETFSEVYHETVQDLEKLLSLELSTLDTLFSSDLQNTSRSPRGLAFGALQLVSILIFSVPNGNSRSSYADALQHSAMSRHALTAAFKIAGCFISACRKSGNVSESPLLPASLVFMEWLASRQDLAAGSGGDDDKQSQARAFFWRESLDLLNQVCEIDEEPSGAGLTYLWEDMELRGFSPLLPAQATINFNKKAETEESARVHRFVAAGKAIAKSLDGSGKGIAFDEDIGRFYSGEEPRERRIKDKSILSSNEVVKQAIDTESKQPSKPQVVPSASSSTINEVEDDDEEVIVFKPVVKEPVAPRTETYGSVDLGVSGGFGFDLKQNGVYDPAATGAPANTSELNQNSLYSSIGISSELKQNDSYGLPRTVTTEELYKAQMEEASWRRELASINPQISQLNDNPLTVTSVSTFGAGDVPGRSIVDTVGSFATSSYPLLAQDLLYRLQTLTAGKEQADRQNASVPAAMPEVLHGIDKGHNGPAKPPLSGAMDVLREDSIAARAKLKPPPGFGPIPQRAASSQKIASQSATRPAVPPDNPIKELWVDNYSSGGRTTGPPPLYGAEFGIWSNTNSGLAAPKSAPYPFPGMGVRTLQQVEALDQPQQPVQQFYGWKAEPPFHQLQLQQQQQQQQQLIRPYRPQDPFVS